MKTADFRAAIDWSAPWLAPYRTGAAALLETEDWREAANRAAQATGLRNHRSLPISFVPQEAMPAGIAYEAYISTTGQVPSRDNLHDFFNALMWLHFPRTKVRLNALQAAEIEKSGGVAATRGKVRDAATIFDENAVIVVYSDPEVATALRSHDWMNLFVSHRSGFQREWALWLFGHALLEKLVNPYKAVTGHAWLLQAESAFFDREEIQKRDWIDGLVSRALNDGISTSAFAPLPIAGVPGWWKGQEEAFYADTSVFRPARLSRN